MLEIKDVAERLGVTERTIRNWINKGYLKAYRFGKKFKIAEQDIEEFINSNRLDNSQNDQNN